MNSPSESLRPQRRGAVQTAWVMPWDEILDVEALSLKVKVDSPGGGWSPVSGMLEVFNKCFPQL